MRYMLGLGLCLAIFSASAADFVAESVAVPAWYEHQGQRLPLQPGQTLAASDVLYTGPGGRVVLALGEGSTLRLGENAQLRLDAVAVEPKGLFRSGLSLLKGALRFTTQALAKPRPRDLSIRIKTVTIGIRGTDVWGKSASDRSMVCLLEGRVEVTQATRAAVVLDQPRAFYIVPDDAEPLPVVEAPADKLQQWAEETDETGARPLLASGGRWQVVQGEVLPQAEALARYDRLREAGYPARLQPAKGQGFQLVIRGLVNEAGARLLAEQLGQQLALGGWQVRRIGR